MPRFDTMQPNSFPLQIPKSIDECLKQGRLSVHVHSFSCHNTSVKPERAEEKGNPRSIDHLVQPLIRHLVLSPFLEREKTYLTIRLARPRDRSIAISVSYK
jgi:hypothetical protein